MSTSAEMRRLWDDLAAAYERGESIDGIVIAKAEGGLAVDVGVGVDAFVAVDQVDLGLGQNRGNLIGRQLDFVVAELDRPNLRVVLSRRALLQRERDEQRPATLERLRVGATIKGVVTSLADHGAVVDLGGIDAALPLYDMGSGRLNHPSEIFHLGDVVAVRVRQCDAGAKRVVVALERPGADVARDEVDVRERAALNREHVTVRVLRHLADSAAVALGGDARRLLFEDPRLIGTLAGVLTHIEVPSAEAERWPLPTSRLETDLSFLALRVRIATGTAFVMTAVPASPPHLVLANVSALSRLPEAYRALPSFSQFRDQWCGGKFRPGSPARESASRASAARLDRAAELLAMLHAPETIPAPLELPTTIRDVGIITYCWDDESLDSLMQTVRAWDENFALFGRTGLRLTVSDDSTPEWSARVWQRLADYESRSGLDVRYISYAGRQAALARLKTEVCSSDKAKQLDAVGRCTLERLSAALDGMFGPRGASHNRNWALLSLGLPCLQTDDDVVPEIFTVSQDYSRARYEAAPNLPDGANDFPADTFPVDILGLYESMPPGTLGSPVSSGADDEEVNEVIDVAGRRGSRTLVLEPREGRTYLLQATFEDLPRGMEITKGPIFLPKRLPSGARYCYLQPPVRDGDMAVASCFEAMGKPPDLIRAAIHHRSDSGSRFSSPASLLHVSTLAQLVWCFIRLICSRIREPQTSERLGWTILEGLEVHPNGFVGELYQWQLVDSIRCACDYVENRLAFEREQAGGGALPDDVAGMVERFGLSVDRLLMGGDERVAERARAVRALADVLEPAFIRAVEDYAWSLIFWDELEEASEIAFNT